MALCFLWFAESSQDKTNTFFDFFFFAFRGLSLFFTGYDSTCGPGQEIFNISPIKIGRARWFSNPMDGLDRPHTAPSRSPRTRFYIIHHIYPAPSVGEEQKTIESQDEGLQLRVVGSTAGASPSQKGLLRASWIGDLPEQYTEMPRYYCMQSIWFSRKAGWGSRSQRSRFPQVGFRIIPQGLIMEIPHVVRSASSRLKIPSPPPPMESLKPSEMRPQGGKGIPDVGTFPKLSQQSSILIISGVRGCSGYRSG